jgi:hypothetical protein
MAKYSTEMDFQFDEEESKYITYPHQVHERSALLKTLIRAPNPVIVDGFACVGGDSVALMADFPGADLYAVQCVTCAAENSRFCRLIHNVTEFNTKFRQKRADVFTISCAVEDFMQQFNKTVDLLYLDPPWFTHGRCIAPDAIMSQLNAILRIAKFHVKFIVIKVQTGIIDAEYFRGYTLVRSLTVNTSRKNKFYFHVFECVNGEPPGSPCTPDRAACPSAADCTPKPAHPECRNRPS